MNTSTPTARFVHLRCTTVLVLLCLLASDRATAQRGSPTTSPYGTLNRTLEFVEYAVLRSSRALGYVQEPAVNGPSAGSRAVREVLRYAAYPSDEETRVIEITVLAHPERGFELHVDGLASSYGDVGPNPDVAAIQTSLAEAAAEISLARLKPGRRRPAYRVYPLSYIQADRAMALLKAVGYATIEFSSEKGESLLEDIFRPDASGGDGLPLVVKMLDAPKTSIIDPAPSAAPPAGSSGQGEGGGGAGASDSESGVPDIGGSYLHHTTSGEQLQRLLIVYDEDDPESLERLLNLLRDQVDLPARQILIEAMVIEINTDRLRELGIDTRFTRDERVTATEPSRSQNVIDARFERDPTTGSALPFSLVFNNLRGATGAEVARRFLGVSLEALMSTGDAEILSRPSVLALDGRQARIQVGQQVPVVKSTSTAAGITSSVEYFTVGIVLNLRPRLNEDGSEITMQVETIVSSISTSLGTQSSSSDVFFAPFIDTRQVQSFVRTADNTPFIIGGLISREDRKREVGIPVLSRIPLLGALFRKTTIDFLKKEVIVVLVPHVVPQQSRNFSYVVPRDAEMFNSFDHALFRNAYRVRDDDVFDLSFVTESESVRRLAGEAVDFRGNRPVSELPPEVGEILRGGIPGEEILVRRMLWEIVHKTGFHEFIDPARILVFEEAASGGDGSGTRTAFLSRLLAEQDRRPGQTLALTLEARDRDSERHPFTLPRSRVSFIETTPETYFDHLLSLNRKSPEGEQESWSVLLTPFGPPGVRGASAVDLLKGVLVLKRVLELNPSLDLSVREFRPGIQVVLPTQSDLRERFHLVDREIAHLFYEVIHYYPEFESAFNRTSRQVRDVLLAPSPPRSPLTPSRAVMAPKGASNADETPYSDPDTTDTSSGEASQTQSDQEGYGWVVSSSVDAAASEREARRLRTDGRIALVRPGVVAGRTWYRVVVGQYADPEEARRAKERDVPADRVHAAWLLAPEASR